MVTVSAQYFHVQTVDSERKRRNGRRRCSAHRKIFSEFGADEEDPALEPVVWRLWLHDGRRILVPASQLQGHQLHPIQEQECGGARASRRRRLPLHEPV